MSETLRGSVPALIAVRMLNAYAYCARLCWIEWVEGEFVDSVDTVERRFRHGRVDCEQGTLAEPDGDKERAQMVAELNPLINHREDQILIFSLGPAESYTASSAIGGLYVFVERHAIVV